MSSKRLIALVCEGPGDAEIIKAIVDKLTGYENIYRQLQPERTLADSQGKYGGGWKGVWKWCEDNRNDLDLLMAGISAGYDCLIIQMDGDVSRKEKEVHCKCKSTVCEKNHYTHPLRCEIALHKKCPVAMPCPDHIKLCGYAEHLTGLISTWLDLKTKSSTVIITIPCDSTDTWIAVAFGDLNANCEEHIDPWDTIVGRANPYHNIRVPHQRKTIKIFTEFGNKVAENWEAVKFHCPQANAFEIALCSKLRL